MNERDYIAAIEKLNAEILQLKRSRSYKLGSAIEKYTQTLCNLRLNKLFSLIHDYRASKKIAKRYTKKIEPSQSTINNEDYETSRIVVYTCIVGNYDSIPEPLLQYPNVKFVAFVDSPNLLEKKNSFWEFRSLPTLNELTSPTLKNRYLKFHPSRFFEEYDYSIYIDGNVRVTSDIRPLIQMCKEKTGLAMHQHGSRDCIYDEAEVCLLYKRGNAKKIREQIENYKNNGFPRNFGLNEANIIVSDLKNQISRILLDKWWAELIKSQSMRDQLAWPFVLWKNNLTIQDVGCLGMNVYNNSKFEIKKHL